MEGRSSSLVGVSRASVLVVLSLLGSASLPQAASKADAGNSTSGTTIVAASSSAAVEQEVASNSTQQGFQNASTTFIGFDSKPVSFHSSSGGIFNIYTEAQHQLNARVGDAQSVQTAPLVKGLGFMYAPTHEEICLFSAEVGTESRLAASLGGAQIMANGTLLPVNSGAWRCADMQVLPACGHLTADPLGPTDCKTSGRGLLVRTPMVDLHVMPVAPAGDQSMAALEFRLTLKEEPASAVGGVMGQTLPWHADLPTGDSAGAAAPSGPKKSELMFAVEHLFASLFSGNQFKAETAANKVGPEYAIGLHSERRRLQSAGLGRRLSSVEDSMHARLLMNKGRTMLQAESPLAGRKLLGFSEEPVFLPQLPISCFTRVN